MNHSTPFILDSMGRSSYWKYIGVFGIFTNLAVAAYYCYIESWTLSYAINSLKGVFISMDQTGTAGYFNDYIDLSTSFFGFGNEAIIYFLICILLNTYILSKGLSGIEKAAKVGMPLLILFGCFLAFMGLTIGTSAKSVEFPLANAWDGLNYLWTPDYKSLFSPGVWLAAAGQIFFTLSVGMGTIQCYASYLKNEDDIALNATTAGFTNEFVEVVLGSLIVVPIAAGYFGLDWVKENISFGMAFQTMPYLFNQWGEILSIIGGVLWFGLLFFAGITSSLAMGTPWMGFMQDEFKWSKNSSAISFGIIVMFLGLPCVLFYKYGFFDQYDYWAGTVSLVIFAMAETILFSWIFGMGKGWGEINKGADITIPSVYKWILKYITPLLLILVFMGALFSPVDNNWYSAFEDLFHYGTWPFDNNAIITQLSNTHLKESLSLALSMEESDNISDQIYFSNLARVILVGLFLSICLLVYTANRKRKNLKE